LEGYRISLKISQGNQVLDKTGEPIIDSDGNYKYTDITPSERKDLIDLQMKLSKNTTDTSKFIEDLKQTALADSGNVLMKEFSNMLKYHHDNDQMYTGIGICDECNKRVIFKTNFITFRQHYEKQFKELIERLKKLNNIDVKTIDIVKDAFLGEINDDSVKETYLVKHTRALEKALITLFSVIFIAGVGFVVSGSVGSLIMGLLTYSVFVYLSFIPLWSILPALFVAFFVITWGGNK
jgi:hypothetical protein